MGCGIIVIVFRYYIHTRGALSMTQETGMATLTPQVSQRDHQRGPETATVTLVEYGDYECPSCGSVYPLVKELKLRLGDRLRFVFRNFPLTQSHPHAEHAAEAAEAAAGQEKFWEMHDYLFEHQQALDDTHLVHYADALNLDREIFMREMTEHVYTNRVHEDFLSGIRSGVNGTPTFFINGVRHDDSIERETLISAIEAAMSS
jgi:protein-disulfide isomerase